MYTFFDLKLKVANYIKQSNYPVTQDELRSEFHIILSKKSESREGRRRIIVRALKKLLDEGQIDFYPNIRDMRRKYYIRGDAQ